MAELASDRDLRLPMGSGGRMIAEAHTWEPTPMATCVDLIEVLVAS